jgi:hypothetical protein
MTQAPVGREPEWRLLQAQLSGGQSALVVITGAAGSGRTHLLREFGRYAAEQGVRTIGVDPDEPLVIEPTTRLNDVRRTLTALIADDETAVDDAVGEAPSEPLVKRFINAVSERFGDDQAVMSMISDNAPLVIGVDGYEPSPSLSAWVLTRLLGQLRATDQPVMLIVVDRPDRVAGLASHADLHLELAQLEVDAIAEHLRATTSDATHPLEHEEIAAYAAAASQTPQLLNAFVGVLAWLPRGQDRHVQA